MRANKAPGPRRHARNHVGTGVPRQAARGGGQHERAAQGHHGDGARRPREPPGPGLHPRLARALLHRAGYAEVSPFLLSAVERGADAGAGTRLCSERGERRAAVWDWRAAGRRSVVRARVAGAWGRLEKVHMRVRVR